jgi:transcriptional regulator with GAF, ATPase, and Fis domain
MTLQASVKQCDDFDQGPTGTIMAELRDLDIRVDEPIPDEAPVVVVGAHTRPDLVAQLRKKSRRVIAVSTDGDAQTWSLLNAGASDVLSFDAETASAVAARLQRWASIDAIVSSDLVRNNLVGAAPAWVRALEQLVELARFSTRSVLITGESGTGKEMAARLVHTLDRRPDKGQLVILDCTTIVQSLSGSELFGHAKGAFTGAGRDRAGAFKLADRGTLFLDEIGELPLSLQSELLRVIQEGTYKPVGSDRWERTTFRLVCATNRDLSAMQGANSFRSDLYHRITAGLVRLPPLSERLQDIPLLARHFLRAEMGDETPELSPQIERFLTQRNYPGNVRDLKQLLGRMCCRHVGPGALTVGDLPEEERPERQLLWKDDPGLVLAVRRAVAMGAPLRDLKESVGDMAVDAALTDAGGNLSLAARHLQVTNRALQLRQARRS